jgi:hypothetical protein
MKYLRRFNESSYTQQDLDELKEFCDDHLSYLIDEDYKVGIQSFETEAGGDVIQVVVRPPKVTKPLGFFNRVRGSFSRDEEEVGTPFSHFKDRLIPFVYMLLKDYRLLTNEEVDRMRLGENEASMGFAKPNNSGRLLNTEMVRVSSLDDLEKVEDDLKVSTFYIRVKKKD